MKIVIYIESLRTFTSGMPHRGVLYELIKLRENDNFLLVLRDKNIEKHLKDTLDSLKNFHNCDIIFENRSRKTSNILALLNYKKHCKMTQKADIYLSFDCEYLYNSDNNKTIVTVHDLSSVRLTGTSSIKPIQRLARRFTILNGLKNADHIISISNFTKDDILDYLDILEKKVSVIYNGIDSTWFNENELESISLDTKNYWIWWGGYTERKNLLRLLKAYELLVKEKTNIEIPDILFIGNQTNYLNILKKFVNNSILIKNKVFFESQKDIKKLKYCVKNSKGLIFPSLYEGFGLPVIEAYSQGVPVLTSNVSSLPEISDKFAILINPENIESIKTGLGKFINFSSFKKDEAIEYAKKFHYTIAAKKYSKIIDDINK